MKMQELKREENFEYGFIDPDKINEETIDNVYVNEETPEILLDYFRRHRDKITIFWPYNFK